jgi:excisionase family DNA binding protein
MTPQPDPYMDIKALAEYACINKKQLRALVKEMPHFRPGRKFLIKKSVFDTHMRKYIVNAHPVTQRVLREFRGFVNVH